MCYNVHMNNLKSVFTPWVLSGAMLLIGCSKGNQTDTKSAPIPMAPPASATSAAQENVADDLQAQVNRSYMELSMQLRAILKENPQLNTPIYILLMEGHHNRNSLLYEVMLLDVIKSLDREGLHFPNSVCLEMGATEMKNLESAIKDGGVFGDKSPNEMIVGIFAKQTLELPVFGVDMEASDHERALFARAQKGDQKAQEEFAKITSEGMEGRNAFMAKTIREKAPKGGVVIVGGAHAHGIFLRLGKDSDCIILDTGGVIDALAPHFPPLQKIKEAGIANELPQIGDLHNISPAMILPLVRAAHRNAESRLQQLRPNERPLNR